MGEELIGVTVAIVGAIVFYTLAAYIAMRKDKDLSHKLFIAFAFSIGSSQLLAFFEFGGPPELTNILLRFDLSFLIIGAYHLVLFADYFREGLNKKFVVAMGIPTVLIVIMIFTVMIKTIIRGPYGWAGEYYLVYNIIYGAFGIACIITSLTIFLMVKKVVEEEKIKKKMNIMIAASILALIGAIVNVTVIITIGRIFPIVETSLMIAGLLFFIGLEI